MSMTFVALNHDRKEAFTTGKYMDFVEWCDEACADKKIRPNSYAEMLAYVREWTSDWEPSRVERIASELMAFGIQDVYEVCDDIVLDNYRDYIEVATVYGKPDGLPLHDPRDENEIKTTPNELTIYGIDPAYTSIPLTGSIGTLVGMTLVTSTPIDKSPVLNPEKPMYGWRIVDFKHVYLRNPKTHLSKRRRKIINARSTGWVV